MSKPAFIRLTAPVTAHYSSPVRVNASAKPSVKMAASDIRQSPEYQRLLESEKRKLAGEDNARLAQQKIREQVSGGYETMMNRIMEARV